MARVTVNINQTMLDELKREAEERGVSLSWLVNFKLQSQAMVSFETLEKIEHLLSNIYKWQVFTNKVVLRNRLMLEKLLSMKGLGTDDINEILIRSDSKLLSQLKKSVEWLNFEDMNKEIESWLFYHLHKNNDNEDK